MWDRLSESVPRLPVSVWLLELLDILIVAFVIYLLLVWLAQRASRTALLALLSLLILFGGARLLNLYLTSLLFQVGATVIAVILVLVFQDDIRRGLERIAIWRPLFRSPRREWPTAALLTEAAAAMAKQKIGALVVLPGHEPLDRHVRGGVEVDGRISLPLLYSIFNPDTPGHDGAVIIKGSRIERLGVHLPLSSNLQEVGAGGTRHTAALGLAERCDALVIVVSEERGTISIAQGGQLTEINSSVGLEQRLEAFYEHVDPPTESWRPIRGPVKHLPLKFVSLVLASLLWLLFAFDPTGDVAESHVVRVAFEDLDENRIVRESSPAEVKVILSGNARAFARLDPSVLAVSIDMSEFPEGAQRIRLGRDHLTNLPEGMVVTGFDPEYVSVTTADKTQRVELPVAVKRAGELPEEVLSAELTAVPATIAADVPIGASDQVQSIPTQPIDLSTISGDETRPVRVVPPEQITLIGSPQIQVKIAVQKKSSPEE